MLSLKGTSREVLVVVNLYLKRLVCASNEPLVVVVGARVWGISVQDMAAPSTYVAVLSDLACNYSD